MELVSQTQKSNEVSSIAMYLGQASQARLCVSGRIGSLTQESGKWSNSNQNMEIGEVGGDKKRHTFANGVDH